jgi:hypothetical protein
VTADGTGAQQIGELRQVEEPVRIPRRPVLIHAIGDPEDAVMRLRRFLQQRRHAMCVGRLCHGHHLRHPNSPSGREERYEWIRPLLEGAVHGTCVARRHDHLRGPASRRSDLLPDRPRPGGGGDTFVVAKGIKHKPSSPGGSILMFEPSSTSTAGDRHDGDIPDHVDSTAGHDL